LVCAFAEIMLIASNEHKKKDFFIQEAIILDLNFGHQLHIYLLFFKNQCLNKLLTKQKMATDLLNSSPLFVPVFLGIYVCF